MSDDIIKLKAALIRLLEWAEEEIYSEYGGTSKYEARLNEEPLSTARKLLNIESEEVK